MADSFISSAINAYKTASSMASGTKLAEMGDGMATQTAKAGLPSFSDFLDQSANQSISSIKRGESVSIQGMAGKATLNDMVAAVTNAELTLQTVVAVRDKVIGAYQDIMRMPI